METKNIKGGATIWARQTIESDIFIDKPDKWFKIWFFIVNRVNHADNKQFKRGSCFTTYQEISQYTRANKNEIDHCIRWLKSATMITTRKATRGFIITVLKYDRYQVIENYKSDKKSDLKAIQKRNESDTINKNDKNDSNHNLDINKDIDNNILRAKPAEENPDPINQIIDIFYNSINPNINYGNKTTRGACEFMIKKYGFEKTKKVAEYSITLHDIPYAPTVTTPYELKVKMSAIIGHWKKYDDPKNNKSKKGKNIIGLE